MKIIAALCMLVDHLGILFFPFDIRFRIIGRLAMPIFAYGVARGAIYTSSLKKYMKKMLLFSFVSQIPYWGMAYLGEGEALVSLKLNVGFTFFLALAAIKLLRQGGIIVSKEESLEFGALGTIMPSRKRCVGAAVGCLGMIVLADFLNCDYGSYGVLMVLWCYIVWLRGGKMDEMALGYVLLTGIRYYQSIELFLLQATGVLAYGVIYATKHYSEKRWGKFFYWFYPVHMAILVVIRWWQIQN